MSECVECGQPAEWQHDEVIVWIRLCDKHRCDECEPIGAQV